MSATARAAAARPSAARRRPTPAKAAARRRPTLTEVPAAPAAVAGAGVFALVVVGMLVAGMGVLLVLNTSLAQGAFELVAPLAGTGVPRTTPSARRRNTGAATGTMPSWLARRCRASGDSVSASCWTSCCSCTASCAWVLLSAPSSNAP